VIAHIFVNCYQPSTDDWLPAVMIQQFQRECYCHHVGAVHGCWRYLI